MRSAFVSKKMLYGMAAIVVLTLLNFATHLRDFSTPPADRDLLPKTKREAFLEKALNPSQMGTLPGEVQDTAIEERLSDDSYGNPFGPLSMETPSTDASTSDALPNRSVPQVVVPVVIPPSPPTTNTVPSAPPLPFTFIGLIVGNEISGGKTVAFLNQGNRAITVSEGDAIGVNYKVEAILENRIDFLYVPLGTRQSLTIQK